MSDDMRDKRVSLLVELAILWDEYRIPRYEVAQEAGIREDIFSKMLSGERPVAFVKAYDGIVKAIKKLRASQEEPVG